MDRLRKKLENLQKFRGMVQFLLEHREEILEIMAVVIQLMALFSEEEVNDQKTITNLASGDKEGDENGSG